MDKPDVLLKRVSVFKKIMSHDYRITWTNNYSKDAQEVAQSALWTKRKTKIERINLKIENALKKTQQVTPAFIDQLIGFYERKIQHKKTKYIFYLSLKSITALRSFNFSLNYSY